MVRKWIKRLCSLFGTPTTQYEDGQQGKKSKSLIGRKQAKVKEETIDLFSQSQLPARGNISFHSTGTFSFSEQDVLRKDTGASSTTNTRSFTNVFTPTKRTDLSGRKLRRRLQATSTAPYATWIKADEIPEPYVVGQSIDRERFQCLENLDPETRRNLMIDIVQPLCIYEVLLNIKK